MNDTNTIRVTVTYELPIERNSSGGFSVRSKGQRSPTYDNYADLHLWAAKWGADFVCGDLECLGDALPKHVVPMQP